MKTAINIFKSSSTYLSRIRRTYADLSIDQIYRKKQKLCNNSGEKMTSNLYKLSHSTSVNPVNILTNDEIAGLYNTKLSKYCKNKDDRIIQRKLYLH